MSACNTQNPRPATLQTLLPIPPSNTYFLPVQFSSFRKKTLPSPDLDFSTTERRRRRRRRRRKHSLQSFKPFLLLPQSSNNKTLQQHP
jgi:hypothetical protein